MNNRYESPLSSRYASDAISGMLDEIGAMAPNSEGLHEKYVEPSKGNADIIIPHGGRNSVALDLIIGRIERHLRECGR